MRLVGLFLGLLLTAAFSPAVYHNTYQAAIVGNFASLSPSPTTIYGTWSTTAPGTATLACGTVQGTYNLLEVPRPGDIVSSNNGIVSGLTPGTLYYCRATVNAQGVIYEFDGSTTTLSAPATTAITDVDTSNAPIDNNTQVTNAHKTAGDSYYTAIASNGNTYVTQNDSSTFGQAGSANTMMGIFSPLSPPTGTNVNTLPGYGPQNTCNGPDHRSPKTFGIYAYAGQVYMTVVRFDYTGTNCNNIYHNPQPTFSSQLIRTPDFGTTFCNFQGRCATGGVQTNPEDASLFGSSTNFGSAAFGVYGADDGTMCGVGTTRVDGCDAYLYLTSTDDWWNNGSHLYLARIPKARLKYLSPTDVQYWTGGDGNLNSNWSPDFTLAADLIPGSHANQVSAAGFNYVPKINRYLLIEYYYPSAPATSPTTFVWYESPHPWGDPASSYTWNSAKSATSPGGNYVPAPIMSTIIDPTLADLTLTMGGDFGSGPAYHMWVWHVTLKCGVSSC